ncbi:hypothetical protein [Actinoallomurus acaciae]|uniref:Uncharacterized protein n=1 Tax=Actinoallomurus acaciae TaxID=502577 RepID=A0ABV5YNJ0_9ACTN
MLSDSPPPTPGSHPVPPMREVLLTIRRVVDYAQVASSLCCR